jgi:hypothetical protein
LVLQPLQQIPPPASQGVPPGRQQLLLEQVLPLRQETVARQLQAPSAQDCPGEQATQAFPPCPQSSNWLVDMMQMLRVVSQQPWQLESQLQTCVLGLQL